MRPQPISRRSQPIPTPDLPNSVRACVVYGSYSLPENDTLYRSPAAGARVGATVGLGVGVGLAVATAVGVGCTSVGVPVGRAGALSDGIGAAVEVAFGKVVGAGPAESEQATSKSDIANAETDARTATSCIIGLLGSHSSKEGLVPTSSIS